MTGRVGARQVNSGLSKCGLKHESRDEAGSVFVGKAGEIRPFRCTSPFSFMANVSAKPLFLALKTTYFRAFLAGTKTTEFRVYGKRWNERTCFPGRRVTISLGYRVGNRRTGRIVSFRTSQEATQTPEWIDCYGTATGIAACIEITLDEEEL
jgi:hypothetical protein